MEYNEDLAFTMDDLTSPYYGCSMMLNGEYFILRLEQVKQCFVNVKNLLCFSCTGLITEDVLLKKYIRILPMLSFLYHKMNANLMHLKRNMEIGMQGGIGDFASDFQFGSKMHIWLKKCEIFYSLSDTTEVGFACFSNDASDPNNYKQCLM